MDFSPIGLPSSLAPITEQVFKLEFGVTWYSSSSPIKVLNVLRVVSSRPSEVWHLILRFATTFSDGPISLEASIKTFGMYPAEGIF